MKKLKLLIYITFLIISGIYLPGCKNQQGSDSNDHNHDTNTSTFINNDVHENHDEEHEDEEHDLAIRYTQGPRGDRAQRCT